MQIDKILVLISPRFRYAKRRAKRNGVHDGI